MPGFEMVSLLRKNALLDILRAAWKSGGDQSGTGVIPQHIEKPDADPPIELTVGSLTLTIVDWSIQLDKKRLALDMSPDTNGIDITLGLSIQLDFEEPPITSLMALTFDADLKLSLSFSVVTLDIEEGVNIDLKQLPADAITTDIPENPILPLIDPASLEELLHYLFEKDVIPRRHEFVFEFTIYNFPISMKTTLELYNDATLGEIALTGPDADNNLTIRIPCHLRFSDYPTFDVLVENSGIIGVIELKAELIEQKESVEIEGVPMSADLQGDCLALEIEEDSITLTDIKPAPEEYGDQGENYEHNRDILKNNFGIDLDAVIRDGFKAEAVSLLSSVSESLKVCFPSMDAIEILLRDWVSKELQARGQLNVWKPDASAIVEQIIQDVTPKALDDALALCINEDPDLQLTADLKFLSEDREFASVISKEFIETVLNNAFPMPQSIEEDITLNSLNISLDPSGNCIKLSGNITWKDAISKIDLDFNFSAGISLEWIDTPDGGQAIRGELKDDPDVGLDMEVWGWIVTALVGFFTFGAFGAIIATIARAVTKAIVDHLAGKKLTDGATEELQSIGGWPEILENIGTVAANFSNPILIVQEGIVVSGDIFDVVSDFEITKLDLADSHGPYSMTGGQLVAFDGGEDTEDVDGFWDFGDGESEAARKTLHAYGDGSDRVAKVEIKVNQEGGITTRHFARVDGRCVPPEVTLPGSLAVIEGQEFEIVAKFTDQEWLNTHKAYFDWGDNTTPHEVNVNQTNDPPQTVGEVRAKHTYCDSGIFKAILNIEDNLGCRGFAMTTIKVENIAPTVKAPEKLCVLVDQPVQLQARFTDPGWCDTHTATWDFGDCQVRDATIEETNTLPQAEGTATATHVYQCCGIFQATITVTDDDGGIGEDTVIVDVRELQNPNMEAGFRDIDHGNPAQQGQVANEWETFFEVMGVSGSSGAERTGVQFFCEKCVYRDGQRAQYLEIQGRAQAGIYQTICANVGWDYEFTAFYHAPATSLGKALIGIDPSGGISALSPDVVWVEREPGAKWRNLSVRATARSETITLFLGLNNLKGERASIYWDKAYLFFIQPFCPEETCQATCISFAELEAGVDFTNPLTHRDLTFTPLGGAIRTVTFGEPQNQVKLAFPNEGVRIDFPRAVSEVTLTVLATESVEVLVFDGETVLSQFVETVEGSSKIVVEEPRVTAIVLRGADRGAISEVCFCSKESDRLIRGSENDITTPPGLN